MGFINLDDFLEEVIWAMPEREFFREVFPQRIRKKNTGSKNAVWKKRVWEITVQKNTGWKNTFGKIQFGKYSLEKYSLEKTFWTNTVWSQLIFKQKSNFQIGDHHHYHLLVHLLPFLRSHIRFQSSCVFFLDKIKLFPL